MGAAGSVDVLGAGCAAERARSGGRDGGGPRGDVAGEHAVATICSGAAQADRADRSYAAHRRRNLA
eukprot:scaffold141091_cov29-Tisochrysis_lutea.AAC.3